MNSSIICDYITLFISDANQNPLSDLDNGVCVWDIPESAYYFKDRGSVCLMSIASSTLPKEGGEDIIVMTQQGRNGFTTQENSTDANKINNDLAVLGSYSNMNTLGSGATIQTQYQTTQVIKLLTSAKPRQIRLVFFKNDKTPFDMSSSTLDDEGHVTIKFEYINPERLEENNYGVEYKPAFPDVKSF